MNLRSANTMDLDSSQKLFRLVVEHGMSRQSRKRVLRDSSGTNNESQIKDELQPPRKLNRRQRMSLSVIPPPEYISQMFKSKDNIVDCSTQQPKKRMRSELKKNRTKMIDRYNKENFGTNERKTKRKTKEFENHAQNKLTLIFLELYTRTAIIDAGSAQNAKEDLWRTLNIKEDNVDINLVDILTVHSASRIIIRARRAFNHSKLKKLHQKEG
ncbi:hypothetical protein ACOME3_004198 [Neoechinorhynchus agilis]